MNYLLLVLVLAALIAVELSTVIGNDLLQPPREMEERDGWVDQFGKKWNWDGCLNDFPNGGCNTGPTYWIEIAGKRVFRPKNCPPQNAVGTGWWCKQAFFNSQQYCCPSNTSIFTGR